MNTGSQFAGRPSLGSWVSYGLGTPNENLPAFVVMQDIKGTVVNGPRNWGSGFMPAVYQGTAMQVEGAPFLNLVRSERINEFAMPGRKVPLGGFPYDLGAFNVVALTEPS